MVSNLSREQSVSVLSIRLSKTSNSSLQSDFLKKKPTVTVSLLFDSLKSSPKRK